MERGAYPEQREHLLSLSAGWDGYGADPVNPAVLDRLLTFLGSLEIPLPHGSLVPAADGSVQYEYHGQHFQIEIYAETDGSIGGWLNDRDFNEEREADNEEAVRQEIYGWWLVDSRPS